MQRREGQNVSIRHRPSDQDIASYFDSRVGCCAPQLSTPAGRPGRVSARLRESLADRVVGRSVLEIGCGTGDLLRYLVERGAARATGVDMAPAAVAEAIRRAKVAKLADRMRFVAGNAATLSLEQSLELSVDQSIEPHDIVVLDKVICCYADRSGLLDATLPIARRTYAFSIPRTDGGWHALTPLGIGIENVTHRLAGRRFRAFAHDNSRIGRHVEAAGFALVDRSNVFAWMVAVYERPSDNAIR
ncbi:MAG TPA: methyltransferase domain-containing protein [Pseudonocardiaceae bacterium]